MGQLIKSVLYWQKKTIGSSMLHPETTEDHDKGFHPPPVVPFYLKLPGTVLSE